MKFNEGQLKAIETRGKDILVSASAGSGKTAVMIERVLRLIESGAELDRMLIVTFTKAAAADMRARLFEKLCERSDNSHCRDALDKLPQADISTLHSFCVKLARTYFYAIEVDPAFELLGDGDAVLLARCLDEVAENYRDDKRLKLYDIMLSHRKDSIFKRAVEKLYLTAVGMPDPFGWLDNCLRLSDNDDIAKAELGKAMDIQIEKLTALAKECLARTRQAGFVRNIEAAESVEVALENRDISLMIEAPRSRVDSAFVELNEQYGKLKRKASEILSKAEELDDLIPSANARWCGEALRDAAKELASLYSAQKRKNCVADYNDLEHFAYDILSSDCAGEIRDRYDYIFVDEYQDINPLQDAIIQKIKKNNNLFMVGDLKQSIYAFRGCDPSIFSAKRVLFEKGDVGINIELNENFRTLPIVIKGINRVFDKVMTAGFGGIDYKKEARLIPHAEHGGRFRYVNIVTEKAEEEMASDSVYRISRHNEIPPQDKDTVESDFIVEEILKLLTVGDSEGREVKPSDIAVLTRSRTALSYMICEKLKAAGVPAFVKDGGSYGERPELIPLIAMLKLTDNEADDVALATVLRSYIVKLSSDDLAKIALDKSADEPFYAAAKRSPLLVGFYDNLKRYIGLKQSVSAGELLSLIATDSDAFIEVRKLTGGEDNVRSLIDFLACAGDKSVEEFLDFIKDGSPSEIAAPEGCLKIMTVHMSKGLEFPYVFLAQVSHKFNNSDFNARYIIDAKWGLAFKYPDENTHEFKSTYLFEAARLDGMRRAAEEELRILYVALTRAKRELVISGTDIETDKMSLLRQPSCPADLLTALIPEKIKAEPYACEDIMPKAVPVFAGGDSVAAEKIRKRMASSASAATKDNRKIKTSVTALAHSEWESEEYDHGDDFIGGNDSDAAERGTAYHLFMQFLDFDRPFDIQKEEFEKRYPTEAEYIDFSSAEKAAKLVGELIRGYKLYREKEFVVDDDGTLVQGIIDLLAVNGREAIIVDYKTGSDMSNPRYAIQLELYASAAERLLDLKVKSKYICALDLSKLIELK